MKKLLSVFLALVMVFALCGGALAVDDTVAADDTTTTENGETAETPAEETPEATEEPAEETPEATEEPTEETPAATGDIVVLYTNDVHCAIDGDFGYSNLAAYAAEQEAAGNYVTIVDIGDAIQGGPYGTLTSGEAPVDVMNAVGYDVATMGNHEFDYGMDRFMELAGMLECGYVSCNFVDLRTGELVFEPYKMITYGDTQVAYIGITTPETYTKSTPSYFQDENGEWIYGFSGDNLAEMVQSAVDAAKAEGADYIVAVGHLGIDTESSPWMSTEIIPQVSGLDAFLDGHSHSTIASQTVNGADGEPVVLTSTGTKFENFGVMTIAADGTITTELVAAGSYTATDADVDTVIAQLVAENEAELNTVVAETDVTLRINDDNGTRLIRNQETNLGDLCADAYRVMGNADIGLVNGGGIRADIPAGDITYGQIINVHPYSNMLCVVEATGQEIVDALEMGAASCPGESGGFLQVSGLSYTIDTTIPSSVTTDDAGMFTGVSGERRVKDVMVNGEPIDLTATYTVASHNYMLKDGGDGINMFMDNTILVDETMLDNEVLINYITETLDGVVPEEYAEPQGRITVLTEPVEEGFFTDVAEDAWYYEYVVAAYENGLMVGVSDTEFAPNTEVTRGMLVAMVYQLEGSPEVEGSASELFTDVADDAWYADALVWASQNGLLEGFEGETFDSETVITREELAEMLYAYELYTGVEAPETAELTWADADAVSADAVDAVAYCTESGLMNGVSDTEFDPAGSATRAMCATVLVRLFDAAAEDAVAA